MKVTFLQTADPFVYHPMLDVTAKTVRHYCLMNGFAYESYVGIKRGQMAWQASFNRIFMLKELLDRGVEGWAFYLDADAFIADLRFDLMRYLSDKDRYGAIFAGHISNAYDINSGGFAVNLSHPAGRGLISAYYDAFEARARSDLDRAISWEHEVVNDQHLLYLLLKEWNDAFDLEAMFLFEHTNHSHVNNGPFIQQHIRGAYASFGERLDAIRGAVAVALAKAPTLHPQRGTGLYIPASHPRLQTVCGHKTGAAICTTGTAGMFLQGPHARVDAGRYQLRILGRTSGVLPDCSVVAQGGAVTLSIAGIPGRVSADLLAEHTFTLVDTVHDLEVRMEVRAEHELCIHAVQIVPVVERAVAALDRPFAIRRALWRPSQTM